MAKPVLRKAAKDYESDGIKKGDQYWYVSIKTGPRSSRVMRQLAPFKSSQLTTSPFRSGWFDIEESWNSGDQDEDAAREAAEALRELANGAQESFDNMPEGLQQGDTGQQLENRANEAENAADQIDEHAETIAEEAPEEPNPDDFDGQGEFDEAFEDWTHKCDEIESSRAESVEEITNLLSDMPE